MKNLIKSFGCAALLALCSANANVAEAAAPKYEANWGSLAKYNKEPEWFKDSKLGIYFHWGPYCVPAFGSEWYPYYMYRENNNLKSRGGATYHHHQEKWGADFDYHDFIPMFKGEHFDAVEWAQLFKNAGAKFAGPVVLHHDGFAMWDSEVNPWNSADMGPKRDITGELFREIKKNKMKTIATFHHARTLQRYAKDTVNWDGYNSHFAYHPDKVTSTKDEKLKWLYGNVPSEQFHDYWLEEIREVVQGYHPDIIWFDTWLDRIPMNYLQKMVALQYNDGAERVVTYKHEDLPRSLAVLDIEQGGMKEMPHDYWMTDITLSYSSWSYISGQTYKPVDMVLRNMIDVWSKRGIVLLNISPRADGVIVDEQRTILNQMGEWLDKNAEAVYGTRSHSIYGYGTAKVEDGVHGGQKATLSYTTEDVRFTTSKDGKTLYAFVLGLPEGNKQLTIKNVSVNGKQAKKVSLLNSKSQLKWSMQGENLVLTTPAQSEMDKIATIFKLEF